MNLLCKLTVCFSDNAVSIKVNGVRVQIDINSIIHFFLFDVQFFAGLTQVIYLRSFLH